MSNNINFYEALINKVSSYEKTASTKEALNEFDDNQLEIIAEEIGILSNKVEKKANTIQEKIEKKAEEKKEDKAEEKKEDKAEEKKEDKAEEKKEDKAEEKKEDKKEEEKEEEVTASEILYNMLKEAAEVEYREEFANEVLTRLEKRAQGEELQPMGPEGLPIDQDEGPEDEVGGLIEEVMQYVGDEGLAIKIVEVADALSQQSGIPIEEITANLIEEVLQELQAGDVPAEEDPIEQPVV